MLSYDGQIHEYNTVLSEFQNLTILDLIREFNNRKTANNNGNTDTEWFNQNDKVNQCLDAIAKHFGYYDRLDLLSRNQYGNTFTSNKLDVLINSSQYNSQTVNDMNEMLNVLAQLYGYSSYREFTLENKNAKVSTPINKNETLLRIDMVWLKIIQLELVMQF